MGSFQMIMILEFTAKNVHVLVPENYKTVQTFLLNTLYETLNVGTVFGDRKAVRRVLILALANDARNGLEYLPSLSCIRILHGTPAEKNTLRQEFLLALPESKNTRAEIADITGRINQLRKQQPVAFVMQERAKPKFLKSSRIDIIQDKLTSQFAITNISHETCISRYRPTAR